MKHLLIAALILCIPLCAVAQSPSNVVPTRVLVPLYYEQPINGALGSLWRTDLTMFNGSQSDIHIETCFGDCLLIEFDDEVLRPGESQHVIPQNRAPWTTNGAARLLTFYSFDAGALDKLSLGLRVADVSRASQNAGTEVPIVREKDFRTATTQILDVPIDSRFRLTFRLYEMAAESSDFTVRTFDSTTNHLLRETNVHLNALRSPLGFRQIYEPGYAQLGEQEFFSQPAGGGVTNIRVEIEPRTPGSQFWAFVAVTNNTTQQPTLVTPQ